MLLFFWILEQHAERLYELSFQKHTCHEMASGFIKEPAQ